MKWVSLLKGLLVTTVVSFVPFKVSADLVLPKEIQEEADRLMPKGDFRQGMQLGMMTGTFSTFCLMVKEGAIVPGEGPMNAEFLNELSSNIVTKLSSDFDEYLIEYQKLGLNMAITKCNKLLGVELDFR